MTDNLSAPGDRRRFVHYCRQRNMEFESASCDRQYDLVVVTQGADLSVWVEYNKGPMIFDFIDSYLSESFSPKRIFRGVGKYCFGQNRYFYPSYVSLLRSMCRKSAAVVCSTVEQKHQISAYNGNVHVILDSRSEFSGIRKQGHVRSGALKILWEGLPQNVVSFKSISEVLGKVALREPVELNLVTDLKYFRWLRSVGKGDSLELARRSSGLQSIRVQEWSLANLHNAVNECDIAVIPMLRDPLFSGKPENKLLILWGLGIPTLCSNTPAYSRADRLMNVQSICASSDEWLVKLDALRNSVDLRAKMSALGLKTNEMFYSESELLKQWDNVVESVLG